MDLSKARSGRRHAAAAGASSSAAADAAWPERRFVPALALMAALALVQRGIILWGYLRTNPLSVLPVNDAETYWNWAGRIASGVWGQEGPFFSAPLYPFLLGLLRWLGGTLTAVYVWQLLADLATGVLLARLCRRRFGAGTGLLAAGLFWLTQDPASFSLRILASTLHLLLASVAWTALVAMQARPSPGRAVGVGVALGLLCLAYAPATVLVPLVAVWLFLDSGRRLHDGLRAVMPVVVAALLIAPATLHNWYASGGELFLVQSGSGITLRQGNAPSSTGGYTAIPGISTMRERMHEDASRLYEQATGDKASWAGVDRYFRQLVWQDWRAAPGRALALALTKLYWFFTARNYGDIYAPTEERAHGLNPWLRLAPLPVAWLTLPAAVGLVWMLRHPLRYGPEWLLFVVPLAVVVMFFYSPRYRAPAVPIIVGVAAWTLTHVAAWRSRKARAITAVAASAAGALLGPLNAAISFDRPSPTALAITAAYAFKAWGQPEKGLQMLRDSLHIAPDDAVARMLLGDLLYDLGRREEAIPEYERARALRPDELKLLRKLGQALFELRRFDEAERVFRSALELRPDDAGLLTMLADTKKYQGQVEQACELYGRAVELVPDNAKVRGIYAGLLLGLKRWEEARAQYGLVARSLPDDYDARYALGLVCGQLGDFDRAQANLERAVQIRPRSVDALYALGAIHLRGQRVDQAAEYFRQALAVDPNEPRCRAALEHIAQLRSGGRPPSP